MDSIEHQSNFREQQHPVLVFDGICNLCEALVVFIVKRDKSGTVRFATAQSEVGRLIQAKYEVDAIRDTTMILLKNDRVFTQSDAAIEIARNLDGLWKWLSIAVIIPRPLRDACYRWIGRNRYRWFGAKNECLLPTGELASRFVENRHQLDQPKIPE